MSKGARGFCRVSVEIIKTQKYAFCPVEGIALLKQNMATANDVPLKNLNKIKMYLEKLLRYAISKLFQNYYRIFRTISRSFFS